MCPLGQLPYLLSFRPDGSDQSLTCVAPKPAPVIVTVVPSEPIVGEMALTESASITLNEALLLEKPSSTTVTCHGLIDDVKAVAGNRIIEHSYSIYRESSVRIGCTAA
jgi:hypothetical protein